MAFKYLPTELVNLIVKDNDTNTFHTGVDFKKKQMVTLNTNSSFVKEVVRCIKVIAECHQQNTYYWDLIVDSFLDEQNTVEYETMLRKYVSTTVDGQSWNFTEFSEPDLVLIDNKFHDTLHKLAYMLSGISKNNAVTITLYALKHVVKHFPALKFMVNGMVANLFYDCIPIVNESLFVSNYIFDPNDRFHAFLISDTKYDGAYLASFTVFSIVNSMVRLRNPDSNQSFIHNYYIGDCDFSNIDVSIFSSHYWTHCPCSTCYQSWKAEHKNIHPICQKACCHHLVVNPVLDDDMDDSFIDERNDTILHATFYN